MSTEKIQCIITNFLSLTDCIDRKYGAGTFAQNAHEISKKCSQKCLDVIMYL